MASMWMQTGFIYFKQEETISILRGKPLKLVDHFTKLGNHILFTESNINSHLAEMWTAIVRLSTIWKFDLSNRIKWNFFQAVAVSILLYRCTTWMLTKYIGNKLEKELHTNATCCFEQILEATLQKTVVVRPPTSHLTNHPNKMNKTWDTAREVRMNSLAMFSYRLLLIDMSVLADQQRLTYISSVWILDAV